MAAYFDFHCHPSFKSALNHFDVDRCPSPWKDVEFSQNLCGIFSNFDELVGDSFDSQSSFNQIKANGTGCLVVVNLLAFERAYTFVKPFQNVDGLDFEVIKQIGEQKISYFDYLRTRMWTHLKRFNNDVQADDWKYRIIQSMREYPRVPEEKTIYVLLGIEGAHNFYTSKTLVDQDPEAVIQNLRDWKKESVDHPDDFPRLFYITLTHHAQNLLTNHAWAIPPFFAPAGANNPNNLPTGQFNPREDGLTEAGKRFIRTALRQENGQKRILIDLKHMSLRARLQYYDLLREDEFIDANIPVLASHMAMTGTPLLNPSLESTLEDPRLPGIIFGKAARVPGVLLHNRNLSRSDLAIGFNPWSINLFDEEIVEIIASGGLIGISLDARILGQNFEGQLAGTGERFSVREFATYGDGWKDDRPFDQDKYPGEVQRIAIDDHGPEFSRWHFCLNVIHVVLTIELARRDPQTRAARKIRDQNIDPWVHLCLGSDYDGLITALNGCKSAADLANSTNGLFSSETKRVLIQLQSILNAFYASNASPAPGMFIGVPDDVIDLLRLDNAVRFLRAHFA